RAVFGSDEQRSNEGSARREIPGRLVSPAECDFTDAAGAARKAGGYSRAGRALCGALCEEVQTERDGDQRGGAGVLAAIRLAGKYSRIGKCDGTRGGDWQFGQNLAGRFARELAGQRAQRRERTGEVSRGHSRLEEANDFERVGAGRREYDGGGEVARLARELPAPVDAQSGIAAEDEEADGSMRIGVVGIYSRLMAQTMETGFLGLWPDG